MRWFINFPTRAKLFLGFGTMILFLAAVVTTASVGVATLLKSQEAVTKDFTTAVALVELRSILNRNRSNLLEMMLLTDRKRQEALEAEIRGIAARGIASLQRLSENGRDNPDLLNRMKDVERLRIAYLQTRERQFDLIYAGKIAEARQLGLSTQEERYENMHTIFLELGDAMQKKAVAATEDSRKKAYQATRTFAIISAIAVLFGLATAGFMNRIIADPLKVISSAAERVAVGDLSVNLPSNSRADEVGVLAQSFSAMMLSLRGAAGVAERIAVGDLKVQVQPQSEQDTLGNALATMVKNLLQMTADIVEAAGVLGSSAGEISVSTSQLASSAAQAATAVAETTTTVEEMRQTAQVSSQKANLVAEGAQEAEQISQAGKQSAEETSEGMMRIRDQMAVIANGMMRLSEQSQAIGTIIATVDDLAQQSNLLAVNASIEAAKAGEQGKGFAVVAQEVKSLADQSRQATMQVRTLLNDIQKATAAAVLATEQGSKAVEAGVQQSAQTRNSILVLADSVAQAAQSATQIAASSQQQLVGVEQMALAMGQVKQASTQNVDSAKQLEAAAQSLNELGERLQELVGQYAV